MKEILYKRETAVTLIILTTVAVFLWDYFTPLGIIVWALYIIPILIVYWGLNIKYLLPFTAFVTALVLVNLFKITVKSLIPFHFAVFNRTFGICIFFYISIVLLIHKKKNNKIKESEAQLRSLYDNMIDGYAYCKMIYKNGEPADFIYLEVNRNFEKLTGLTNVKGRKVSELIPGIRESDDRLFKIYGRVALTGEPERFETFVKALDDWYSVSVYSPAKEHFVAVFEVVTERKRLEKRKELSLQILSILNRRNELVNLMHDITSLIKAESELDVVAIRLKVKEDYPFIAHETHYLEFIKTEGCLVSKDEKGEIRREANGNVMLECLCGWVIQGNTDSSKDYFTKEGSFWTNSLSDFMETTPKQDLPVHMRNRCRAFGYESMALIPIHSNGDIVGLIQMNDKKSYRFNKERIDFFESIANSIGIAFKRVKAERQALNSLRNLAEAGRIAHLGYWEYDVHYDTVTWSDELMRIFGRNERMNKSSRQEFMNYIYKDDLRKFDESLKEALNNDNVYKTDFRILTDEGSVKFIVSKGNLEIDKSGNLTNMYGIAQDVTEQVLAEAAIRASEEKYRSIYNNSSIGILLTSPDEKIYSANEYTCRMFGRNEKEICEIGRDGLVDVTDPRLKPLLEEREKTGMARGELRFIRKDGTKFESEISSVLFNDSEGRKRTSMTIRDLTEQKQAEQQMQLDHEILTNVNDGFNIIRSEDNIILFTSRKFETMFGYNAGELIGRHVSVLNAHDESNSLETTLNITDELNKNGFWRGEILNVKKDGTLFWCDAIVTGLKIDKPGFGNIWISVHRDITERKLTETELIKAKEKAEESDRLKSAFLANMSHEIRTPMNAIMGFSKLLSDPEYKHGDKEKYASIIDLNCEQLLTIIDDIIDISKLEAEQVVLKEEPFKLNDLMKSVYKTFKQRADEKKLDIKLNNGLNDNESEIFFDKNRLQQILYNLISNAIKFTNKGVVDFGYIFNDREQLIEFYVKDTGIGIADEHHKLIFERFRQVDPNISRKYGGNGLGLAICKSLVELIGGKIWLESKTGEGSTFYFTIPFKKPSLKTIKDNQSEPKKSRNIKDKSILIVEDEPYVKYYLNELLYHTGAKIFTAENGKKAVEMFIDNSSIDIVLMDLKMPEMDGFEATRRIKKIRKDVIVIAQTAYAMKEDREKAFEAGCDDFITKPIKKDALISLVMNYV